jgi:hypothetical protein
MEQKFLFETLLFFNKAPCYYKVFAAEDVFYGEPVPHHFYRKISFPYFRIKSHNGQWKVDEIQDSGMKERIILELEKHL